METNLKPDIEGFKVELKALLEKYKATISCDIDGDTHGLSYEMNVDFSFNGKWKTHKLSDNNEVGYYDLK